MAVSPRIEQPGSDRIGFALSSGPFGTSLYPDLYQEIDLRATARACSGPIESGIPEGALKSESIRIDSLLGGGAMARAYSPDMRERVIARVESGGSRREAAEYYDVSASTAVNWVKCFRETG